MSLSECERELADYLLAHPELESLQYKIQTRLERVGDEPSARMAALAFMLVDNLDELATELKLLQYVITGS